MKEYIKNVISWLGAIKKKITPFWLQWSFFPKVGQPPLQSFVEIAFYLSIVCYCTNLFLDFNRIPENVISFEYDRLNDYRYLSRDPQNDSTLYLHYQAAKIGIKIPMVSLRSEESRYVGGNDWIINDDSMRLIVSKDQLKSTLNNYWLAVINQANEISKINVNSRSGETSFIEFNDFKINLDSFKLSKSAYDGIAQLQKMLPDSLSESMKNFYRIKLSTNYIGGKKNLNVRDSAWHIQKDTDKDEYPYHKWFLDNGNDLVGFHQFEIFRANTEYIDSTQFAYFEGIISNNRSKQMDERFNELFKKNYPDKMIINPEVRRNGINISMYNLTGKKDNNRIFPTEPPGWLDRYDISQGRYHIYLNTSTIDSTSLTIDFVGATEFYPNNIEPDIVGGSFIKFTNPQKIFRIRKEGLTFYAKFKELENLQTVRCFAVTTLISGLIIILLTFFIIGVCRSLQVILKPLLDYFKN